MPHFGTRGALALATVVLLGTTAMPPPARAERTLLSGNGIDAVLSDESDWCGDTVSLVLRTDDASAFEGDRLDLQRLLGGLRAVLGFECPAVRTVLLTGEVSGTTVFNGRIGESAGWTLEVLEPAAAPVAVAGAPAPAPAAKEPSPSAEDRPPAAGTDLSAAEQPAAPAESASAAPANAETAAAEAPEAENAEPTAVAAVPESAAPPEPAPEIADEPTIMAAEQPDSQVSTPDGSCTLFYPPDRNQAFEQRYLEIEGVGCRDGLVHGMGRAMVVRSDGRQIVAYEGAFSHGYFTHHRVWEWTFHARITYGWGNEALLARLGADDDLGIEAFALLDRSSGAFRWCESGYDRPEIIVHDPSDATAYLEAAHPRQVVQAAATLARRVCPEVQRFDVRITADPLLKQPMNEVGLLQATAVLTKDGQWQYDPNQANNYGYDRYIRAQVEAQRAAERAAREAEWQRQREEEERRRAEEMARYEEEQRLARMEQDYQRLHQLTSPQRNAYRLDVSRLSSLPAATARSLVRQQAVEVALMVRVDDVEGDEGRVGWPRAITLSGAADAGITEAGWYLVKGAFQADEPDGNRVPSGRLAVATAIACAAEACRDTDDLVTLVGERHGMPDWTPASSNQELPQ